jgi:hypothetical protein
MVHSDLRSPVAAKFGAFLYAPIGEDNNGMLLTVLSALARQNVDPWEEAADLSRLPGDAAMRRLTSMMAALPQDALADCEPQAVVARLIVLLPHSSAFDFSPRKVMAGVNMAHHSPAVAIILSIVIYLALMMLGQWLIANVHMPAPVERVPTPAADAASPPRGPNGNP